MPKPTKIEPHILALDMGDRRVGLALASSATLLAKPLKTITNDAELGSNLKEIIKQYAVSTLVVGLPRNLNGSETDQTTKTRGYIDKLASELDIKMLTQDEALSSVRAREELTRRGKIFDRADIDKLAACLILEDYIASLNHEQV